MNIYVFIYLFIYLFKQNPILPTHQPNLKPARLAETSYPSSY